MGTNPKNLALYREKFRRRLPESPDELHGQAQGVVELPLHMAWSGIASYDMSKPRQRMGLYRTVLHEGLYDDLPRYLNRDLLIQLCRYCARSSAVRCALYGKTPSPARLAPPGSRVKDVPELHTRLLADVIVLGSRTPWSSPVGMRHGRIAS
ncbi:hypothetical protein AB0B51_32845 [Streptomyces griseus]|uniref:hypothetical protein n=1 Tax=Streptomyces griseus TaxID=1911 RepID=UPI000A66F450|nr:hypothetical protein [Streptomyces griseus]